MTTPFNEMERSMGSQSAFQWSRKTFRLAVCAAGAFLGALCLLAAQARALDPAALPTGGRIAAGQGRIDATGSAMTVTQDTQRMIADWNSFNIGSNASVAFVQPGASSVALNRIQDTAPSQIFGRLSANGQVFLLNPAGVIFGPTARVNVGALVASSLALSNEDFLAGRYALQGSGPAGFVLNQGRIRTADGGYIAFVAPQVKNQGTIESPAGLVAMAAGNKVRLDFAGDNLVNYIVDQGAMDALAENSGTIAAHGGTVMLSAKAAEALTRSVVNHTGVIEAKGLSEANGRIFLDADGGQATVSGILDASSALGRGGRIVATGDRVRVASGAHLNASGAFGGGEALVGGAWQGDDPSIRQAIGTIIEAGALLEASATDTGDGGTVVAWSDVTDPDSVTRAYGTFEAMGGPNGGDGGRIETSGHWLDTAGATGSAGAGLGSAGIWLFDPYNITIAGSATANGDWSGGSPDVWTPSTSGSTILNTDLNAKLATTDVTITTTGGGAEDGDITVTGAITIPSMRNLKLLADGSVTISANISGSGGRLFLESGASGAADQTITINNSILLSSGQLTLTSTGGATANAEIDAYGLLALYGTGAFNINSHSGSSDFDYFTANLTGTSSIDLYENNDFFYITNDGVTCSGDVTLRAVRDFNVNGPIDITGAGNLELIVGTGSWIRVSAPITLNSGAMTFSTESGDSVYTISQSVTASGAGLAFDQPVTLSGTPEIRANGSLAFNSTLTFAANAQSILAANDFTFSGDVTGDGSQELTMMPYSAGGDMDVGAGGDVDTTASQFTGFSSLTLGRSDGTGTLTVVGDTSVSTDHLELVYQTVNVTGGTLANTGGDIVFTGDSYSITRGITANGGAGKVTMRQLTAANPITLGTGVTNAQLDQISAGTLEIGRTDGGDVTFDGNITTATDALNVLSGGNITLNSGVTLNVGTGTATLAAGGNFINNAGADAITTSGDGRWLVYSTDPAANTFGGLASGHGALWNKTYAGYPPASVTETGNRYLFSTQPALTVTAADRTKTYVQTLNLSNPAAGTDYTVTGLVDASAYGDVFTQDATNGSPALASAGAAAGASVAGAPYAITAAAGTFAAPTGYGATTYTAGSLTVNKAPLTVTAANDSKIEDGIPYEDGNGVIYAGFASGETEAVLGGLLAYGGDSQEAVDPGTYDITPSGLTADNYTITFVDGTLTIAAEPVTDVVPDNLLSPQASVNGTQTEQGGRSADPTTPALGPGSGSTTLAAASTTPLVGSAPVLSSAQVTTTVRFSTQGSATTMEIGSGAGTGPMADVGAIPVFNQTGQGAPVAQGSLYVRESASAVSVTPGDAVSGAPAPAEPGIPDGSALSFTLATPEGMTIELSASVTENGVLVIDLPDAAAGVDPSQAVLMGMTIVKKEKNIGAGALKGVLLRRR